MTGVANANIKSVFTILKNRKWNNLISGKPNDIQRVCDPTGINGWIYHTVFKQRLNERSVIALDEFDSMRVLCNGKCNGHNIDKLWTVKRLWWTMAHREKVLGLLVLSPGSRSDFTSPSYSSTPYKYHSYECCRAHEARTLTRKRTMNLMKQFQYLSNVTKSKRILLGSLFLLFEFPPKNHIQY